MDHFHFVHFCAYCDNILKILLPFKTDRGQMKNRCEEKTKLKYIQESTAMSRYCVNIFEIGIKNLEIIISTFIVYLFLN